MSKQIIFCADGTWNGPGTPAASGGGAADVDSDTQKDTRDQRRRHQRRQAVREPGGSDHSRDTGSAQRSRARAEVDAGETLQVAKYMHGVGDSKNPVLKVLGGVLGAGVIGRIIRGYTFISRYYEPGDSIHIVGFSRGAYTARALAGMIAAVGLLNNKAYDPNNKTKAYLMGLEAWMKCKGVVFTGKHDLASRLTDWTHAIGGAIARLTTQGQRLHHPRARQVRGGVGHRGVDGDSGLRDDGAAS